MRVLVLSDTPFLPPAAGNCARISRMVDYLTTGGHEVAMLLLARAGTADWDVEGMRAQLAWLEVASGETATPASAVQRARARLARAAHLLTGGEKTVGVDDWCPPWFQARARARIRDWKPDVVLVEYVFLSACLDGLDAVHHCVTVIDTHDVMHRRHAVYEALGMQPQWFQTTRAEERCGLLRANIVLAIQEEEAAVFRAMVPERLVLTVPHAHPLRPASLAPARPRRLLFVASYNDVNVRGLAWFLDGVWPPLRAFDPRIELVVCGNIATKLGALPEGVVARGFVSALDEEYAAARVVVSPTLGGTGLKVKAIEALCHGRPVVSTRAGAVGLDVGEAEGVLVADEAEDFAAAVRTLLDDESRWQRAAAAASAQAARRFTPEAVFAPLVIELQRSATRRPSG
jgi:glycosyltransferase involved in cell wall biosynthesis